MWDSYEAHVCSSVFTCLLKKASDSARWTPLQKVPSFRCCSPPMLQLTMAPNEDLSLQILSADLNGSQRRWWSFRYPGPRPYRGL